MSEPIKVFLAGVDVQGKRGLRKRHFFTLMPLPDRDLYQSACDTTRYVTANAIVQDERARDCRGACRPHLARHDAEPNP